MFKSPLPPDEPLRLAALRGYGVLDTPPERAFDDLAAVAAGVCGTPVALVSLVDEARQWFKAKIGTDLAETCRDLSFCAHAICRPELMVVPDARLDPRFSHNPLVTGPPGIRFYAGAPLVDPDGFALGSLCVIDVVPRELTKVQADALSALARAAVDQLLLRKTAIELRRQIDRRASAERRLRHAALHDALTGLPNRLLFLDRLGACLARSRREPNYHFAVLFLDLDRFKVVNDSLGHAAGDKLLVEVSRRLRRGLRSSDGVYRDECRTGGGESHTVARLGGDEFTVLLDCLRHPTDAVRVADRLRAALGAPVSVEVAGGGRREVACAASIGVAVGRPDYARAEEIVRDADAAMYRAKAGGPGSIATFEPALHEAAMAALTLECDLRAAIKAAEDGEASEHGLSLAYQPVVALPAGLPVGFEALARWNHPRRGNVPPPEFIGLAEASGLIDRLGAWVARAACGQLRTWLDDPALGLDGTKLKVGINVSPRQLRGPALPGVIAAALAQFNLPAGRLTVEVTETAAVDADAAESLGKLRAMGVGLALDDFGTGHSSLSCLHRLPVGVVKIDRSFVAPLDEMPAAVDHGAVIDAIITLAHSHGLSVVAEGVETASQADRLIAAGCDLAQGYHFARPLTAERAAAYLLQFAEMECRAAA